MRALLAITARELRERWALPLATFCAGFVPLLIGLREGEQALRISGILAVPTAWTVAFILGGSVIARDLGDGRLGFFFTRPVPWWTIAGGKLLAAVLLTLLTTLAAALPFLLAEGDFAGYASGFGRSLANGSLAMHLVLLLGLVGFGHAAGVVYRSRSAWAALDFLLFAAAVAGAIAIFRAFVALGVVEAARPPEPWTLTLGLLPLALVPLAATGVQMAQGRSQLRRGHGALSLTLWGGAFALFAVAGVLLARERAASPAEFEARHVTRVAGDSRFVALEASGPRGQALFVLDTQSGRALRVPRLSRPSFSPEGRHAVWVEDAPFWRLHDLELVLAHLDGPAPLVETVELDQPLPEAEVRDMALAAAGERVAVVQRHTLAVYELPSGRSLSRSTATDGEWVTAAFLPDGRLRALRRVRPVVGGPDRGVIPGFLELVELAGGVPSSRVPLEAVGHASLVSGITGDRILLLEHLVPTGASLHDVRSGRRLRAFVSEPEFRVQGAKLLGTGAVAVIEGGATSTRLRLAADDAPDRLVELPARAAYFGSELPQGRVAVGLMSEPRPGPYGTRPNLDTLVVALATGTIERRETGLWPAGGPFFESAAGELVRLDPDTGERKVVVPARPQR
jgi:hypothetical protein